MGGHDPESDRNATGKKSVICTGTPIDKFIPQAAVLNVHSGILYIHYCSIIRGLK